MRTLSTQTCENLRLIMAICGASTTPQRHQNTPFRSVAFATTGPVQLGQAPRPYDDRNLRDART